MIRCLLDMAFDAVIDNIDRLNKNLVKECIEPIRRMKLNEILCETEDHHLHCDGNGNHIKKLWANLPYLINSLKYVRFDTYYLTRMRCRSSTLSNSRFQEFIRCLDSNTPNLEELKIKSPRCLRHTLAETELDSITHFRYLKTLIISRVRVPLSGLMELTRRCEKLESMDATHVEIDVELSGVIFSEKFKFISIDTTNRLEDNRLILNLKTTMPTLTNFEGEARRMRLILSPKRIDQFSKVRGLANVTEIEFWSHLLEDIERMDEFPHFPEVKLADLYCSGTSAHGLRCFLQRNGQTLQKLTLEGIDAEENMTFAEVFSLCPNLESLKIFISNMHGNNAPVQALRRLKQFEWRGLNCSSSDPVAFSSILLAPLLEDVYIYLPNIDLSDNATVINWAKRRETLRKLKKFEVVYQRLNANDALDRPIRVFKNSSGIWTETNITWRI